MTGHLLIHQHVMQLPILLLLAFSKYQRISTGFTAEQHLQPQLLLLPAVLPLGNMQDDARSSPSVRDPRAGGITQTCYDRTTEESGKHRALRLAFYSKGLGAVGMCGISSDQRATSKNTDPSQKEESNHPTVCFTAIFLLPIRSPLSSPDKADSCLSQAAQAKGKHKTMKLNLRRSHNQHSANMLVAP